MDSYYIKEHVELKKSPYPALAVARVLLEESLENGLEHNLTNMKMNKLVYICHGWHLGWHKEPLVSEPVEVWQHGPVFSALYFWIKYVAGTEELKKDGKAYALQEPDLKEIAKQAAPIEDGKSRDLIKHVFKVYHRYSGWDLVELTHAEGSPWGQAEKRKATLIPDLVIQEYYERKFAG